MKAFMIGLLLGLSVAAVTGWAGSRHSLIQPDAEQSDHVFYDDQGVLLQQTSPSFADPVFPGQARSRRGPC